MSQPPRTTPRRRPNGNRPTQRQIIIRRSVALGAMVSALAVATVVVVVGFGQSDASTVQRYADAWAAGDTKTMYEQLSPESQSEFTYKQFARTIERARDTATVRSIRIDGVKQDADSVWSVDSKIATRAFGTIDKPLEIRVQGGGDNARINWDEHLAFPGIPSGASLSRDTELPARAALRTRDDVPLAQGATRESPLGTAATNATGSIGAIPAAAKARYYALGYPSNAQVGISGLEKAFEARLAGKPGGTLRGGAQTIASSEPRKGADVKTTIDSKIQQVALQQMGLRQGGIVVLKPRTGEILGYAGTAFSGLQPPGSTFKIITLAGGLQDRVVEPGDTFPVVTSAQLSGVELENADREYCGGTLTEAFAKSCNSVFAPIGAKLGAKKLIEFAERFGFNERPTITGARTSVMPSEETLSDDLQVGSAAIGQSTVQATPLQMATVAATIALRGRRPELTLDYRRRGRPAKTTRVVDPVVARTVERMMVAVVNQGTGEFAAIPGVRVAGKTGTAELRSTQECNEDELVATTTTSTTTTTTETTTVPTCPEDTDDDTTAWFTSFAPAGNPEVAVCVMFVASGQGRVTAAPAAKALLQVALGKQVTVPAPATTAPNTTAPAGL